MNTTNDVVALSTFEHRLNFCNVKHLFFIPRAYQTVLGNFVLYALGVQREESVEYIRDRLMGMLEVWAKSNGFNDESVKSACIKDTIDALAACFDPKTGVSIQQTQHLMYVELTRRLNLDNVYRLRLKSELKM